MLTCAILTVGWGASASLLVSLGMLLQGTPPVCSHFSGSRPWVSCLQTVSSHTGSALGHVGQQQAPYLQETWKKMLALWSLSSPTPCTAMHDNTYQLLAPWERHSPSTPFTQASSHLTVRQVREHLEQCSWPGTVFFLMFPVKYYSSLRRQPKCPFLERPCLMPI